MTTKRTVVLGSLDATAIRRYATHAGVILLILVAFFVDRLHVPAVSAVSSFTQYQGEEEAEPEFALALPAPAAVSFLALTKAAVLRTTIPERTRTTPQTYRVEAGDTLLGIAQKFHISGETVIWANGQEDAPDVLRIGQELTILPVSGVYHTAKKGDTVKNIATRYKVDPSVITSYVGNNLKPPFDLNAGDKIIVPGGQKPIVQRQVTPLVQAPAPIGAATGSGIFGWPTAGYISQKFWNGHPAIDIAGYMRAPVYAADGGYVALAGWSNAGYGNMIILNHGNGFQTVYAHLDSFLVKAGQPVTKGQKIALMGCTGRCTGPHLHFEVHKGNVARNPVGVLP
jgi:murein DD-endopeptidase MepM/ murein hydrolase activator NlpD